MKLWYFNFKRGIRNLSGHDPGKALKNFYEALDGCPVYEEKALAKILFFLGFALKRLGFIDFAVKSWISAQKIHKDRYISKLIKRFVNEYGMCRRHSRGMDDWQAFYAIQLARYLQTKRHARFCSEAEKDMVRELIRDHFKAIVHSGRLAGKAAEEKARLFKQERIVFPFILKHNPDDEAIIHVDFNKNKRIALEDRCPCGSGQHFMACCGRTQGAFEILCGNI